jgi:hypothetical protein
MKKPEVLNQDKARRGMKVTPRSNSRLNSGVVPIRCADCFTASTASSAFGYLQIQGHALSVD